MLQEWRKDPDAFNQLLKQVPYECSGLQFWRGYREMSPNISQLPADAPDGNPLWEYFQSHETGHGIWKWEHYFEIYHRHLSKFVDRGPNVLEIGVYSGGSLEMWHSYFGAESQIFGVDIEPACKSYESDHVSILIGDQADRGFWAECKKNVEGIDVLIDDGGHTEEQQRITLEEMLPALRAGGVYLCEDIYGTFNKFADFAASLVHSLNELAIPSERTVLTSAVSPLQRSIHSLHFYPYVTVIEKNDAPVTSFSAPKHGTQWQPHLVP
jgi:hypothetical protein